MMNTVNMSNQLKIVFSRSLNPIPSVTRYCDLIERLKRFNRSQRYKKATEVTLEDYCSRFNINFTDEIRKPFKGMEYYNRFSKRTYNRT